MRPRPPTLTSIPALLATFQNEWDSAALQIFGLEQEVVKLRKELSNALYQNDAAIRVIARLTQERDQARDALSKVAVAGGAAINGDEMAIDSTEALPEELGEKVDATQKECVDLVSLSLLAVNIGPDYQRAVRSGRFPKVGRPPAILPLSRPSPRAIFLFQKRRVSISKAHTQLWPACKAMQLSIQSIAISWSDRCPSTSPSRTPSGPEQS